MELLSRKLQSSIVLVWCLERRRIVKHIVWRQCNDWSRFCLILSLIMSKAFCCQILLFFTLRKIIFNCLKLKLFGGPLLTYAYLYIPYVKSPSHAISFACLLEYMQGFTSNCCCGYLCIRGICDSVSFSLCANVDKQVVSPNAILWHDDVFQLSRISLVMILK